jgi:transposase
VSTNDSGHYGEGVARRTRRLWTDEEKRSICLQTTAPGVSVAQVALRYTVNANLIFKWLRDPKYRPGTGSEQPGLRFLPVEIVNEAPAIRQMPAAESHIEIDLADGHRIRISGSYDPEALARLIRGLTA